MNGLGAWRGFVITVPIIFLLSVFPMRLNAEGLGEKWDSLSREQKVASVNLGMVSLITVWGVLNWDYFQNAPVATSEGWFGRDTSEGGADKLGHAYTSYAMTHGFADLYREWGFNGKEAVLYGSLSALGTQTFMEFGDSFSRYGFSYEDFIANTVGTAAGYLSWHYPELGRKVDFRVEYIPTLDSLDVFTAYEEYKYVVALKLNGFERLRDTPLGYLELQVGYFARNYDDQAPFNDERNLYVGVGLNVSHVLRKLGFGKTASFFNYYQLPYTNLNVTHDFNQ